MAKMDFTPSNFGGGWLVPLDSNAEDLGRDYFADDASEQPALGGAVGWIVEPQSVPWRGPSSIRKRAAHVVCSIARKGSGGFLMCQKIIKDRITKREFYDREALSAELDAGVIKIHEGN